MAAQGRVSKWQLATELFIELQLAGLEPTRQMCHTLLGVYEVRTALLHGCTTLGQLIQHLLHFNSATNNNKYRH